MFDDGKLVVLLLAYKHMLIVPAIINFVVFFPATTIFQMHVQALPLLSAGVSPSKLMHSMYDVDLDDARERLLRNIEEDQGPVGTLFRSYYRLDTVTNGKHRLLMDANPKR